MIDYREKKEDEGGVVIEAVRDGKVNLKIERVSLRLRLSSNRSGILADGSAAADFVPVGNWRIELPAEGGVEGLKKAIMAGMDLLRDAIEIRALAAEKPPEPEEDEIGGF